MADHFSGRPFRSREQKTTSGSRAARPTRPRMAAKRSPHHQPSHAQRSSPIGLPFGVTEAMPSGVGIGLPRRWRFGTRSEGSCVGQATNRTHDFAVRCLRLRDFGRLGERKPVAASLQRSMATAEIGLCCDSPGAGGPWGLWNTQGPTGPGLVAERTPRPRRAPMGVPDRSGPAAGIVGGAR